MVTYKAIKKDEEIILIEAAMPGKAKKCWWFRDKNFKSYYNYFLSSYYKTAFPKLPSYNRFIEIMNRVIFHLIIFAQINSGKRTGIYYIDSSCLPVCHSKRSKRHKTFDAIAEYGRTSGRKNTTKHWDYQQGSGSGVLR